MSLRVVDIFDIRFTTFSSPEEMADAIVQFDARKLDHNQRPFVITPNVDDVVNWHKPEHQHLWTDYSKSVFVVPDGQPLVTFSKLVGRSLQRRLPGSEAFPIIWSKLKAQNKKAFFILANEKLCDFYQKEYAGCRTYSPPFFSIKEQQTIRKIVEDCRKAINKFEPDVVFVGIQFPKQNILALELYRSLPKEKMPLFLLFGASMEFYAGFLKRAPRFFQMIGMEWFYRFCQQPKRLFKRYFVNDLPIFGIFARELFKGSKKTQSAQ